MTKQERAAAIFFIVIGIAVAINSYSELGFGTIQQPGPGFLPLICGIGIAILSAIWIAMSIRIKVEHKPFWEKGQWMGPVIAIVIVAVYGSLMELLGYIAATFIFLIAWQSLIEREKWKKTAIIAVIGTAGMYILFLYLLKVPLPKGIFS